MTEELKVIFALNALGIRVSGIDTWKGPRVNRYEVELAPGVRLANLKNIDEEIAFNLCVKSVRVTLPGNCTRLLGIEIPREDSNYVLLPPLFLDEAYLHTASPIPIPLGVACGGCCLIIDLSDNLLIGGATGQGKSECLHTIITSLIRRFSPKHLQLVLCDMKRVEFDRYRRLNKPYFWNRSNGEDVIFTEVSDIIQTLTDLCDEMDRRFDLLRKAHLKNIMYYNDLVEKKEITEGNTLPFIVIVMDEFADLTMSVGREAEGLIVRIAQSGKAVGIRIVISTQRTSCSIVTGMIKANFSNAYHSELLRYMTQGPYWIVLVQKSSWDPETCYSQNLIR